MAFSKSNLCHPEGALPSNRHLHRTAFGAVQMRVSRTVVEMLRYAQHDMIRFCRATLRNP